MYVPKSLQPLSHSGGFVREGGISPTYRLAACRALIIALLSCCAACAFNYTDANGHRHTVGIVDITTYAPAAPQTFAGDVVDVASVGLTAGRNAQGGYLALGYNHEITAALRENALVVGDPLSAADAPKTSAEKTP